MHQALYRKWRPKTFNEVCGQEHITSILKQEASLGKFNHAYLFCGSRGTGKTTCAKILAKAVNCENVVDGNPCGVCPSCLAIDNGSTTDVLEMDAASNNGVDNIRDIRDEVVYTPSLLKYRVYIVDEVHMLSNSAFNALLKTLEEPPSHAIFILATTELQKLPATIVSRCQRFEFRRIATDVLTSRIKYIAQNENIKIDDDAARLIARFSQGGMRDSISLLELCASGGKNITVSTVNDTIGSAGRELMMDVVSAIADKNFDFLFEQIDSVVSSSKEIVVFWQDLISLYRDLLVVKTVKESSKYLDLTDYETEKLASLAKRFSKEVLIYHCKMLEDALYSMQRSGAVKRIIAEICFVKMCDESLSTSNEALLLRISKLEAKIADGSLSISEPVNTEAKAVEKNEKKTEIKPETKTKPETKAVSQKQDNAQNAKKTAKPLKCWMEVIGKVAGLDAGAYAFLKKSRAYQTEDGKVHIFVNPFSLFVLDRAEIKNTLAASLTQYTEKKYSSDDLIYEKNDGASSENEAELEIDEIFNTTEQ